MNRVRCELILLPTSSGKQWTSLRWSSSKRHHNFTVTSFYKLKQIEDPSPLVEKIRTSMTNWRGKGRIYVNKVGINAQYCLPTVNIKFSEEFFRQEVCPDLDFKRQSTEHQVFGRLRVRNGKLLEGLDEEYDPATAGEHLSPQQWNQMLDQSKEDPELMVLDARNSYEWEIGHFRGAEKPDCRKFSGFPELADQIADTVDKQKKILMYCTGGIRCEVFSGMLKTRGFEKVYQLEGGILNYGMQSAKHNWKGKLFVFDDRLSVPLDGGGAADDGEIISQCRHCGAPSDTCYNCCNDKCNNLFVSCAACAVKYKACCSETCFNTCDTEFIRRNIKQIKPQNLVGKGDHYRDMVKHFSEN